MDGSIPGAAAAHTNSCDPTPYWRGRSHLINQQRLDYILSRTRRMQKRNGRLLSSSVVHWVVALSLVASHSIPMVWRSLHPSSPVREPDDSTFTKARQRLAVAPLRERFHEVACSLAPTGTPGVFYRPWRFMGIDGTVLDMPDTPANERIFGRGGNQRSPNAFPQVRLSALGELGTRVVNDFVLRPLNRGEQVVVPLLTRSPHPGMLWLGDRGFFGFDLVTSILDRGCHLLARVKTSPLIFQRRRDLPDGSY